MYNFRMDWTAVAAHTPAERDAISGIADWGTSIIETPELNNVVA
jgi:hypothetical protein